MKMKFKWIVMLVMLFFLTGIKAQEVVLKTNLVSDAILSPNLGVEIGMAPRWTLDLNGNINAWNINGHSWKHWMVQPEARYWFCNRWAGHFVGAHIHGGQYNVGALKNNISFLGSDFSNLSDKRYQGWFAGVGVAYGYAWILNKRWTLEAEIGLGYAYTRFDVYPCATCGKKIEKDKPHHYVGPTKAAVNLVYVF